MANKHSSVSSVRRFRNLFFLGFELYRIERNGSLWSKKSGEWKKLKGNVRKDGYVWTTLKNGPDDYAFYLVHRLVLLAFIGPCPEGMEGCHRDGNPSNNDLDNLRWGTRSDNVRDAIRHGTFRETIGKRSRGELNVNNKLRPSDVLEIRRSYAAKEMVQTVLAKKYGVSQQIISGIVNRKTWRYLCP